MDTLPAKIYIQDGAALIQEIKLTPAMHKSIEYYRTVLLDCCRAHTTYLTKHSAGTSSTRS